MTADLGACEWLVWDLRRSQLVDRSRLEQIVSEFLTRVPKAEPPQLCDYLVEHGVLTRFQADSLLNNKGAGLVMGPFVVMDILGTGSMGTVYKAQNKMNGEWFAVKVLPRRSMWNIRVAKRKVRDFEAVKHPSVVPFVDVGTSGSTHYLAWPYVEGTVLTKVVESQGRLAPGVAAMYCMQIAEGLDNCHQKGILHALLKPANLAITPENQVKILDFGVGSLLGETESESVVDTMSTANTMASSLECASPESIMDPTSVSPASDQYSLGCVLYYCLTGQYPFPGNNAVEKMMLHQTREPQPITELVPEVPPELAAIASRLMAKNPADRYPSMGDVVIALRPFAASGYAQASAPAAPAPRPMAPPRPTMAPPAPPQPAYAPPPPAPAWGGGGMGDNGAMEGPGSGMDAPHMPAPRGRQPAMDLNNPPPPPPPPSRPAPLSMPPFPDLGGNPQFSMPPVPSAPLPPPPQFGMPGGGLGQPGPGGFPPPPGGAPVWNQFPNQPPGPMGDPSGFGRHQGTSGGNSNKILVIGLAVAGVLIVALGGAVVWLLMNK